MCGLLLLVINCPLSILKFNLDEASSGDCQLKVFEFCSPPPFFAKSKLDLIVGREVDFDTRVWRLASNGLGWQAGDDVDEFSGVVPDN